uniref:Uncharacterized protein n=1 Tax=Marseillevirus LCMAC101 TaxID=2506602 RepID=A0A481YSX1_9VIRU|nr:MAG: hypothetical protein LCMAC101_01810 [Marseillevirus LCMAC101]
MHLCPYCDYQSPIPYNIKIHKTRCKEKTLTTCQEKIKYQRKTISSQKEELESRKKKLWILKDKLNTANLEITKLKVELAERDGLVDGLKTAPDKRTIYNTAIHPKLVNLPISNIRALTDEYVIERVNDGILTYSHASRGYPGMLEVICDLITHENNDGIIERNYVCTDVSRNSFHRLLESKKWKSDKGGRYLNNMLDTFQESIEEHKDKVYKIYKETSHDSFEWEQINWERKNISQLYSGVVCKEGNGDREELVNILRKEISKRASV